MVENFKIAAKELKRQLKISVYLPKNYNLSDEYYPVIYILDGQYFFQSLDNDDKVFDISYYLDKYEKQCICVGIHSPKNNDWRISELSTFYKKDDSIIDPSLSKIFAQYLAVNLFDILKQRYRINNNVYLLGFKEGAIFNIYSIYKYGLYKGAGIFSPSLSKCENVLEYIDNNYIPNKSIYLYSGNDEENDSFYSLYTKLEKLNCERLLLNYEESEENSLESFEKHLLEFLDFMLL